MKKSIIKLTLAVLFLSATSFLIANQTTATEAPGITQKVHVADDGGVLGDLAVTVYCGDWSYYGQGSECCTYYQGSCIGTKYWDIERRSCYDTSTSQGYPEFRNTNHTTSGPC